MELGKDIEDSVIEDKISAQKPNQCAVLVYTVRTKNMYNCPFKVAINHMH